MLLKCDDRNLNSVQVESELNERVAEAKAKAKTPVDRTIEILFRFVDHAVNDRIQNTFVAAIHEKRQKQTKEEKYYSM